MSDVSRLLEDLYALPSTADDAPQPAPTRAPEWSSEAALDDVFASWVPGPPDDAPAAERGMVAGAAHETMLAPSVDRWLLDTEPVAAVDVPAAPARWSPSDDDILPARGRRRWSRLSS